MYTLRLKDLREDHDLKQKEVAAVLGIDQRIYSNYETGKREIPMHHMIKLALYYQTSLDYLAGLTDEGKPYPRKRVFLGD
ncbi:MAG: helix-turn-helix transcriptional regulator [Clostridiales bacterium]|nr:helix-turn-helix transcriptional regulator [Clostridiales bacterium]